MMSDIGETSPVTPDIIRLRRSDGFKNPDDIYDMTTNQSIRREELARVIFLSGNIIEDFTALYDHINDIFDQPRTYGNPADAERELCTLIVNYASIFDQALALPETQKRVLSLFRRLDIHLGGDELSFTVQKFLIKHIDDISSTYQQFDYDVSSSPLETYQYSFYRIFEFGDLEKKQIAANAIRTRSLNILKNISGYNPFFSDFVLRDLSFWNDTIQYEDPDKTLEMYFSIEKLLYTPTIPPSFKADIIITLKQSTDTRLLQLSRMYEHQVLADAGLNPHQTLEEWNLACPDLDTLERLSDQGIHLEPYSAEKLNLTRIFELEAAEPGSTHALQAYFNISNFGRYPFDVLLRQYRNMHNRNAPYGIALFTKADMNGAFFQSGLVLSHFDPDLQNLGFHLRIIEVGSLRDAARWLHKIYKRYGGEGNKPKLGIIAGHGTPEFIRFGDATFPYGRTADRFSTDSGTLSIEHLKRRGLQVFLNIFEAHSPLIFISCSTGKEDGIASQIAYLGDVVSFAPDNDCNINTLRITRDTTGQHDLALHVEYTHNASTRVFSRDTLK